MSSGVCETEACKLRLYKMSQIACLLWMNLFPYLLTFGCIWLCPSAYASSWPIVLILLPLGLLQIIMMSLLIWGQIAQKNLFIPKNLMRWFLTSIFVILVSFVLTIGSDLCNTITALGPMLDSAELQGPCRLYGFIHDIRLVLLLCNVLLCGLWFTHSGRAIDTNLSSSKLFWYKVSQIACLLWFNLFPYFFLLVSYWIATGYVVSNSLSNPVMRGVLLLLAWLQVILLLLLVWAQFSQNKLLVPKDLKHWFLTSIFVIFISIVIIFIPSMTYYDVTLSHGLNEATNNGIFHLAVSNFFNREPIHRLNTFMQVASLILFGANTLVCGLWFTRTNRLLESSTKQS